MVTLTTTATHYEVETPFSMADDLRSIPGGTWSRAKRLWTFPRTQATTLALHRAFDETLDCDRQFFDDLDEARLAEVVAEDVRHEDDLPQPPTQVGAMWRHQLRAYHFARALPNAMLAMGMGTGKTKVAIDLVQNSADCKVLIIAKRKVGKNVWPRELRKMLTSPDDWTVDVLTSDDTSVPVAKRAAALHARLAAVATQDDARYIAIINYEAVAAEPMATVVRSTVWDRIILDESQHISAHDSKRSKFIATIPTKRRLALTGTPLHQTPLDVYGQFRFLDVGVFGKSWTRFKHKYAHWGGYQGYKLLRYINGDELRDRMASIAIVVDRSVLDLPDSHHITTYVDLNGATRRAYTAMRDDFVATLASGETVTAMNALVKLLRLQQITSGYLVDDNGQDSTLGTDKQESLVELLDSLAADEPVAVFVRFKHDLAAVHAAAATAGRTSLEVSGARDELQAWQGGEATVLAVQIQSGGEGIDLTRAAYCVYYSIGYSLGDYEQSLARVHRPGQTRPVTYYHFVAPDTVDVAVYEALDARRDVIQHVLDALK